MIEGSRAAPPAPCSSPATAGGLPGFPRRI